LPDKGVAADRVSAAVVEPPELKRLIGDTGGGTSPRRGRELYDWVRSHRPTDCLELGFAHGVSTLYIAAALESLGSGRLTSVDNLSARERKPSAPELLSAASLSHRVELVHEETSYNWFLHRKVRAQMHDGHCDPCYDFCFIDGAHTWETDGLAFYLVDKILRPGGWILFDDLAWTMDDRWPDVPQEQRALAQVSDVFELLASDHPSYRELRSDGEWGWARKADVSEPAVRTIRKRDVKGAVADVARMVRGRLSR
jgi:predicted O-methyltransferase YrrM